MSYVPRQIKPEIDTVNNNKLITATKALVIRRIEEKQYQAPLYIPQSRTRTYTKSIRISQSPPESPITSNPVTSPACPTSPTSPSSPSTPASPNTLLETLMKMNGKKKII